MELQDSYFLILPIIFIFTFIALKDSTAKKSSSRLPPGPWRLPLIGNMLLFIGTNPHRKLTDLAKKYGSVMYLQLGQIPTVIISSPEAAREVMRTHDNNFAQRPAVLAADIITYGCTDIVFAPFGHYWQQLRKICITQLLTPKSVLSFRSIREEEVAKLVSWISSRAGRKINISREIYAMTFGVTTRAAFGQKMKDQEAFLNAIDEGIDLAGGFTVADVFPSFKFLDSISGVRSKLMDIHDRLDVLFDAIINERRSKKATVKKTDESEEEHELTDFLDVLMNLQKNEDQEFSLTDDNIKAVIVDVFTAGSDTSSTTLEWALSEMLKNPRVLEKAQAEVRSVFQTKGTVDEGGLHELKYLKAAIKESMRLHPAAPLLLPRECRKSCEIFGCQIPVKTKVLVNAWAIGRDPSHWSQPEEYIPERFLESSLDYKGGHFEFIPFGAGRRICPGIIMGVANVELPLAQLLFHFDWKLPNGGKLEDLDMSEGFGLAVRRKHDLELIPVPYHPPQLVG